MTHVRTLILHYARDPKRVVHSVRMRTRILARDSRFEVRFLNIAYPFSVEVAEAYAPDLILLDSALLRRRWTPEQAGDTCKRLDRLSRVSGTRVAAPLDEYGSPDHLAKILKDAGVDGVMTCAETSDLPALYPTFRPRLGFARVLTGYTDPFTLRLGKNAKTISERRTVFGYRGSDVPQSLGPGGRAKVEFVGEIARVAQKKGWPHDIRIGVEHLFRDRNDWFRFLQGVRIMPGAEGGASRVDCAGRSFDTEGVEIAYAALSPRHIEAMSAGTVLMLLSGRYSGVLEPDVHYVEVKADRSNLESALSVAGDVERLQQLSDAGSALVQSDGPLDEQRYGDALLALTGLAPQGRRPGFSALALRIQHATTEFAQVAERSYMALKKGWRDN